MQYSLLSLPADAFVHALSHLAVADVVRYGVSCKATAVLVFAEERERRSGGGAAGDDPSECLLESWELWMAVCVAHGYEAEPCRSPFTVAR